MSDNESSDPPIDQRSRRQRYSAPSRAQRISEDCKKQFDRTGNPLYAWKTYRSCRRLKQPVPEWVLAYQDKCAERVMALLDAPPQAGRIQAAVSRAFGFKSSPSGQKNPFTIEQGLDERYAMLFAVSTKLLHDYPRWPTDQSVKWNWVFTEVAKELKATGIEVSGATLRRIWKKHSSEFIRQNTTSKRF